jgi:hypothetical protein
VKSEHKFIDSPEFDEFFRRGDETIHGGDTLQPVADSVHDDEPESDFVRTPAQRERRARFIKLVSVTMALLTVGSASAFTYKAMQGHRHASQSVAALAAAAPRLVDVVPTKPQFQNPVALLAPNSNPVATPMVRELQTPPAPELAAAAPKALTEAKVAEIPRDAPRAAVPTGQQSGQTEPRVQNIGSPVTSSHGMKVPTAATNPADAKTVVAVQASAQKPASLMPNAKPVTTAVAVPTKSAVSGAIRTASRAGVSGVHARAQLPRLAVSRTVGPKPEGYHPPTASFSD